MNTIDRVIGICIITPLALLTFLLYGINTVEVSMYITAIVTAAILLSFASVPLLIKYRKRLEAKGLVPYQPETSDSPDVLSFLELCVLFVTSFLAWSLVWRLDNGALELGLVFLIQGIIAYAFFRRRGSLMGVQPPTAADNEVGNRSLYLLGKRPIMGVYLLTVAMTTVVSLLVLALLNLPFMR